MQDGRGPTIVKMTSPGTRTRAVTIVGKMFHTKIATMIFTVAERIFFVLIYSAHSLYIGKPKVRRQFENFFSGC